MCPWGTCADRSVKGCSVTEYLLERSRVAGQILEGERNYHVYYMLLAGCQDKGKYHIEAPGAYGFLSVSPCTEIPGFDDAGWRPVQ